MEYNLVVDARMVNASGIGTYVTNTLQHLLLLKDNIKICLLIDKEAPIFEWMEDQRVNLINCSSRIYSLSEQFEIVKSLPHNCSIYWAPHYNIPILFKGKLLITVHDLFHVAMPQYVRGLHKKMYAKIMFNLVASKANRIICVSDFTRKELVKYTGLDDTKIDTIYNGVDQGWFNVDEEKLMDNTNPYLLYVGNVKPHKNLMKLIQAFELIRGRIPHNLVIVGRKEGFITSDQKVIKYAKKHGDRVKFTGYLSNEDLKRYVANADSLIFPSLYEGFGLPPLEAMACGCPVIATNQASVPEICGDAVLYCDPYSSYDMAKKIELMVTNTKLKEEYRQKGLHHAKKYSWERTAKDTLAVIEKVLSE